MSILILIKKIYLIIFSLCRDMSCYIYDKLLGLVDELELILGCTELPLILTKDEFGIAFLNTTKIHVESAIRYCLVGN